MAKFNIRSLNYMSAGNRGITLNLDYEDQSNGQETPLFLNQTFIVENNTERSLILSGDSMGSFKSDGTVVTTSPMYDMVDLNIKYQYQKPSRFSKHMDPSRNLSIDIEDNHLDVFSPDMECPPIGFVHHTLDGNCYMLTEATKSSAKVKRTTLRESIASGSKSSIYSYVIEELGSHVILYPPEGTFGEDGDMSRYNLIKNDVDNAEQCFEFDTDLVGLSVNYLDIIDQNQYTHPYDIGDVYGTIRRGKNAYNALYSMDMPDADVIRNCRSYCGIGICGERLYMKYYDNMTYDIGSPTAINKNSSRRTLVPRQVKYPYQKVEIIEELDSMNIDAKHKSNVFSIKIKNTNLGESDIGETANYSVKEKLRKDIANAVREFTRNVTPANTTLFDVYFED